MDDAKELELNELDADKEGVSLFKSSESMQHDPQSHREIPEIYDSDPPSKEFISLSPNESRYSVDIQSPGSSTREKDVMDNMWDSRGGWIEDEDIETYDRISTQKHKNIDINSLKVQMEKMGGIGRIGWNSMRVGWKGKTETYDEKAHLPHDHYGQGNFAIFLHILFILYVGLILLMKYLQYPQCQNDLRYFVSASLLIMLLVCQFLLMNINFSRYPRYQFLCRAINVFLGTFALFCIAYLESLTHAG